MQLKGFLTAAAMAAALALSGCQTGIETGMTGSGAAYWQAQHSRIQKINSLLERGRIGIISNQGRFSLNYVLDMQSPEEYTLTLTTSLGSTAAVFTREGDEYRLLSDGRIESSKSLSELFAKRFDAGFPEAEFAYILLGRDQEGAVFDQDGKPLGLNLFPYQFLYSSFSEYKGYALPSEILMRSPDLELRIAVSSVERIE